MDNKNRMETSIPIVLFIVFLALKLTDVITWSWIWVFAPLWIPVAASVAIMLIAIIILSAGCLISWLIKRLA